VLFNIKICAKNQPKQNKNAGEYQTYPLNSLHKKFSFSLSIFPFSLRGEVADWQRIFTG
jgi:hypothetical protein